MTSDDLPRGAQDLIQRCLASMDHVEVLLLLHEQPTRVRGVAQLARLARVDEPTASQVLETLVDADLVSSRDGGYRFKPSPANNESVEQLAHAYHVRPVTLVRAIYSRPAPVTSFSQAFRPRTDEAR
jgi:hypothetical protein